MYEAISTALSFLVALILVPLMLSTLTIMFGCSAPAGADASVQDLTPVLSETWNPEGVYQGYVTGHSDLEYGVLVHDQDVLTFTWPRIPCVFPFELVHADDTMMVYESVPYSCQEDAPGARPTEISLTAGTITITEDTLDIVWTTSVDEVETEREFTLF